MTQRGRCSTPRITGRSTINIPNRNTARPMLAITASRRAGSDQGSVGRIFAGRASTLQR